jgi:hypothetical protein
MQTPKAGVSGIRPQCTPDGRKTRVTAFAEPAEHPIIFFV